MKRSDASLRGVGCVHGVAGARSASRRRRAWLVVLAGLLLMAVLAGSMARAQPGASAAMPPAGLHEEIVLPSASLNGLQMEVRRFRDARSPAELRAALEAGWRARPAPVMPSTQGDWSLITQADGEWVETVGLRAAAAGTEGMRIRMKATRTGKSTDTRWLGGLLGPGATETNRVDHQDGSHSMTTSVWSIGAAPADLLAQLARRASAHGFAIAKAAPSRAAGGAQTLFLDSRAGDLAAMVTTDGSSDSVVFHWRRKE